MKRLSIVQNDNFFKLQSDKSPRAFLNGYSKEWSVPLNSEQFANGMDHCDPLGHLREEFAYPKMASFPSVHPELVDPHSECVYLCGQSLGLMPMRVLNNISAFLKDWSELGVYGHFTGSNPWAKCDLPCIPTMSSLVGGKIKEVAVMNQLSSNIHFMMSTFYQPEGKRYKILCEEHSFPSDMYAINSQIRMHGYDSNEAKIVVKAREGEDYLRTEDILDVIRREGSSIALVFLSGIQFYTGQLFDIKTITRVAQEQGCCVGWDLAHAVGNVPLKLHEWQVDFAVWCSYKYLNSGAGCIGGVFVHSKHLQGKPLKTLDGWWGNRDSTRFSMFDEIDRENTANGFRVSNPSIHQCATLAASLEIFEEAGIDRIRSKSIILTSYLKYLLKTELEGLFPYTIITPPDYEEHGAQLSMRPHDISAKEIHDELAKYGIIVDVRDDILRIAPVALYNSFLDVFRFVTTLKELVLKLNNNTD